MGRRAKQTITVVEETDVTAAVVPFREDPGKSQISDLKSETPAAAPAAGTASPAAAGAIRRTEAVLPLRVLVASPDQYVGVDTNSDDFAKLKASIAAVGIIQGLLVRPQRDGDRRETPGARIQRYEILSGHSRALAATQVGLAGVPVTIIEGLTDAQAFDILAISNLHKDLGPFAWGKMVAIWLDKYGQDAKAVASKLGKSPHWVLTHAMIERNLIPAWKEEASHDADDEYVRWRDYSHWTAAHWVQIARLPAPLQEHWLRKIQKGYPFIPDHATAETVAGWLETETLILAKAPFEWAKVCDGCLKRTDAISQLLWQDPDLKAEEGEAVRCLDPKCWARKRLQAQIGPLRDAYEKAKQAADSAWAKKHITVACLPAKPVPISTIQPPKDSYDGPKYREKIKAPKSAFGKEFLEADGIEIVKEGTKGAVPAIVVAGVGKGSLKWVKIKSKEERRPYGQSATKTAAQLAADRDREREDARRERVLDALSDKMGAMECPPADVVLLAAAFFGINPPYGDGWAKLLKAAAAAVRKYPGQPVQCVTEWVWQEFSLGDLATDEAWELCELLGPVLGFDRDAAYQRAKEEMEADEPAKAAEGNCPIETGSGECGGDGNCQACPRNPHPKGKGKRPGKAKAPKDGKAPPLKCRICGCTEGDCRQCIAKTGEPCHWIEENGDQSLCSACVKPDEAEEPDEPFGDEDGEAEDLES